MVTLDFNRQAQFVELSAVCLLETFEAAYEGPELDSWNLEDFEELLPNRQP